MKEIFIEESKVIQMDILTAIDKFCTEHNITYSMGCGTLLGAIRHKGYIPWDDDIDIYMLRNEYKKFITIFPSLYDEKYKLICKERDNSWHSTFAKIYDNRTLSIDEISERQPIGINIDLFPIDDVPDDSTAWIKYRKKQLRLRKMSKYKVISFASQKSPIGKINLFLRKALLSFVSKEKLRNKRDVVAQENNHKGFTHVFECVSGMYCKDPFPKSLFDHTTYYEFEDRKFRGFTNAEVYLKATYGDYMKLPPKEKQVSHHSTKEYWKD